MEENRQIVPEEKPETEEEKKEPEKKKKKKKRNHWLRVLMKVLIAAVFVGAILCFFRFHSIHDNSMFPSLRDGSLVITANFLSYSMNDVVAYEITDENGKKEVRFGRIISIGGEEVELDELGTVRVNGSVLVTNTFYEDYDIGELEYPYYVDEDSFYIMQDYRPDIKDSRTYGAISKKDIIGKVIFNFQIRNF